MSLGLRIALTGVLFLCMIILTAMIISAKAESEKVEKIAFAVAIISLGIIISFAIGYLLYNIWRI